jgi:hypothetical protein
MLLLLQNCAAFHTFAILFKTDITMASTINSSPELFGESARIFIEEAECNSKRETPQLSKKREQEIRDFINKSRNFIFPNK